MKDDSTDTSVAPQTPASESVEPNTNYSRWMTDIAADIASLKLHQLAIPGAHNSGVDMQGTWGPWELLGACQNNTFAYQFAAGARYLDLRLEDKSYWKLIGNFAPERIFVEAFEFTHGNDSYWYENVSAGRKLQYLISEARRFAETNPGEIIILDFHKFKKVMSDCLERAFTHLSPIKHLLIPNSASDLTIGETRQKHPGRNIVLSFDYGAPRDWKPEWVQKNDLWPSFKRIWSPDDSENNIKNLVIETMQSPPLTKYWALSAAARNGNGPIHLKADHPIRTEAFRPGKQNANIVLVDFIERAETVASVTDKCIALNKLRKHDIEPPSTPKGLTARKVEGDNLQNTVEFNWDRADDGIGVRKYEVYEGDNLLFTANDIPHREKNLPAKNYILKVRAVNTIDLRSDFSTPFIFIQDVTPPTIPEDFKVSKLGPTIVELEWQASSDAAGIAGYEVSIDNQTPIFTSDLKTTFRDLIATRAYVAKVRAKDNSGFYSEYNALEIQPRTTTIENPQLRLESIGENGELYSGSLLWDLVEAPDRSISYEFKKNGHSVAAIHEVGKKPRLFLIDNSGRPTTVEAWISFHTGEIGEISTVNFTFDPTPPRPISNLRILSRTSENTTIAWTPSTNESIENYAISINEHPPIRVLSSANSYTFQGMPMDKDFLIEVWAINKVDICSTVKQLIIEPIDNVAPDKPGVPTITNISNSGAQINWTPSTDNVAVTGYTITMNNNPPISTTSTQYTFTELEEATQYTVEIKAFDAAGNLSEPTTASFTTKHLLPGNPGTPQVSKITHSSAELRWAASSGLDVQYKVSLNGFLVAKTKEPFFTVTHLRSHSDYQVEVHAFNPGGVSGPAATKFRTLLATPVNLRFSHLNGRCRLAWNPVFGVLPSHEISINDRVFTTGPGRIGYSFRLSDLSPGPAPHQLSFKVRAQLDGASSEESLLEKTLTDDAPPNQPGAPIASDITDTSVTLTWEASSDNIGVTGYRVVLNGVLVFTTQEPRYTFTALTPGAYHYVFVRAQDKDGNLSAPSRSTVFKTTGQPPSPPPQAPTVSITEETDTSLILNWVLPDGASGVRIALNDEHWRDVILFPGITMRDLIPSLEYVISVSAFDVWGQLSEPTILTHELKDTTPPTAPGSLRAIDSTSDSVTLVWEASTDAIGVCDYAIYNNQEYFDRTPLTRYSAAGLMPGTHRFEVRALDLSGNLSEPTSLDVHVQGDGSA